MQGKLLSIAALLIASCIVMIIHEIPKTIYFFRAEKKAHLGRELLRFYQFIDPIGLIFCATGFSGFSKSSILQPKNKKTTFWIGILGLGTLFLSAVAGLLVCKYIFAVKPNLLIPQQLLFMVCQFISVISMGMFLVNLFPTAVFDMGFLIAGISEEKYLSVLKNDYFIKMILILSIILGVIKTLCANSFVFLMKI